MSRRVGALQISIIIIIIIIIIIVILSLTIDKNISLLPNLNNAGVLLVVTVYR